MNQAPLTKKCSKCQQIQSIIQFSKNKSRKDGFDCYCKNCVAIKSKQWRINNPEKVTKSCKQWHLNNPEKVAKSCKQWRKKNPEKIYKIKNDWNILHPDKIKEMNRRYYDKHSKRINNRVRLWRLNNPEKIQLSRKSMYLKQKNDPLLKLIGTQRLLVRNIFKKTNIIKNKHTLEYLGCTYEQFVKYIENQFTEGMNWQNHGQYGWHFDHIIPSSFFIMSDITEQKICLHYTNYRPLWWKENLEKSDKIRNINLSYPIY